MNKKVIILLIVLVALGLAASFLLPVKTVAPKPRFDPLNAAYTIDGQSIALVNGKAEFPAAPGSATMVKTSIFGEPSLGDLNGDGTSDAAVFLVQDPGGSGVFYYAAAAINNGTSTQGTNAILLGDRVAPDTIAVKNGQIVANYADRNPGEPMSAEPSVGVTKYLVFSGGVLSISKHPIAGAGERCGGNMTTAPACIPGYHCAPESGVQLPFGDVGGVCTAD